MTQRIIGFLVFTFIIFGVSSLKAQKLQGSVISDQNEAVIAAYILHANSNKHTHTDERGEFELENVSQGDSIQISSFGFQVKKIRISDINQKLKIVLTPSYFTLSEIVVDQSRKEINTISSVDAIFAPVKSSQDLLNKVPGLFIGQHAGGGKAEQIFLRGFDIDHGTDVKIDIDGLPVNMVSHAHGQGYSDLHFIIPETVKNIDYGLGPYYGDKGNFNTAGYIQFNSKEKLDNSLIGIEYGSFNTFRALAMLDVLNHEDRNLYIASEYILSDGYFNSSQNFSRNNFFAKYSTKINKLDKLAISASYFTSSWDASGQIPVRAVEQGLIDRFGAIDDTEGGFTSRTNLNLEYTKSINLNSYIKSNLFFSSYDFELFSNFTFFERDPINGDQIRQSETRNILGFESSYNKTIETEKASTQMNFGVGLRSDFVDDVELSYTRNRSETLEQIQLGDIEESNLYAYGILKYDIGDFLIQPSVRFDYFNFVYTDLLAQSFTKIQRSTPFVSPKITLIYNYDTRLQFNLNSGIGFHSNDSRRILLPATNQELIPLAFGNELGLSFKLGKRILLNSNLWHLFIEQEFVYVGDEGIVEPSGRTQRVGIDLGVRYNLNANFRFNVDATLARPRSLDDPSESNRIPLAPIFTASGSLNYNKDRFDAGLNFRYVSDRPANEDNSIVAEGYFVSDLFTSYRFDRFSIGLKVENVFNAEWNETQFATLSRLQNELEPVEEIHFTPGTPINVRGLFRFFF